MYDLITYNSFTSIHFIYTVSFRPGSDFYMLDIWSSGFKKKSVINNAIYKNPRKWLGVYKIIIVINYINLIYDN